MIVNDLVVTGARPLIFLDYIATGKLDPDQIETIIKSIQRACEESDCLLVGGEFGFVELHRGENRLRKSARRAELGIRFVGRI